MQLRKRLYANNGGSGDLALSFSAPLRSSLAATLARGSPTPTFTRATTAYVEDHEGLLKPVLSGEARFKGARRVYNLTPTSSASIAVSGNKTYTVGVGTFVFSMGAEATGSCVITFTGTATGSTGTLTAHATKRTAATLTITGGGTIIATCTVAAAADVQLEAVTGQANQNPSEYVSVGVLSAPYHGANVDGVKYFDTENGNTVASNVVTEAAGAAISSSVLLGYLAEGARTNLLEQSAGLSDAVWTKVTAGITANDAVAPNGMTEADLLKEDGTTAQHYATNPTTKAASSITYTLSAWVKRHGADTRNIALALTDGATGGLGTVFNPNDGTIVTSPLEIGTITGWTFVSAAIDAWPNGWYRAQIVITTNDATQVDSICYLFSGTNISYLGDNASGVYVWGAQLEAATFASTYIPTTTIAVARNADVLTYPASGNFNDAAGSVYCEAQVVWATSEASGTFLIGRDANGRVLYRTGGQAPTSILAYDGTTAVAVACSSFQNNTTKFACKWGGGTMKVFAAGTAGAADVYDGAFSTGAMGVGNGNAGGFPLHGTIRNVRFYNRSLSDAALQAMTT